MSTDTTKLQDFVGQHWDTSVLPTLTEYIRIPNKSPHFDADWAAHGYMDAAIDLLAQWSAQRDIRGYAQEIVRLPGRTPLLLAEVSATPGAEQSGTVLLYGHYDKQPEFTGWEEGLGPWLPVERDGKLYGRGGADDGYALFGSLLAIEALQRQNVPHPRCVIMIEGCEESGSYDLPFYVEHLREQIGSPQLVICLDAECGNYDQLWVTTSLRGMLSGTLQVEILTEGQHSGAAGGIVPSSFRLLRNVMDRIEDAASGRLHDCLYVEVPDRYRQIANASAQVLGRDVIDRFPWVDGATNPSNDIDQLLRENAWGPSLATVGLGGAPAIEDAGNTLRPGTQAKLVFRLPPSLEAEQAAATIKAVLESDPPYGAAVTFDVDGAQTGWHAPEEAPWLAAALEQASHAHFGQPVMHMGIGGTIPFMKMLGDAYPDTQFFITGLLGPKSNAHGPNEFLHIETGKRLTCCVADVLAASAAGGSRH